MTVTLTGDSGNNTLTAATSEDHLIYGGTGHDDLTGAAGNDSLYGGTGDDDIDGRDGTDYVEAQDGNDTIYGEIIYAGSGDDLLLTLAVPSADALYDGGTGSGDVLQVYGGSSGAFVDLQAGLLGGGGTVVGIEIVYASEFGDTLIGGVDSALYGMAGRDLITLGSGASRANGDDGRDTIYGGTGNGIAYGGADNDRIYGGSGNETLNGGEGADSVTGGGGADDLNAGLGPTGLLDTLSGGGGNDTLHMESADNGVKAYGGGGQDLFVMDAMAVTGDDLYGGGAVDTLDLTAAATDTVIVLGPAGTLDWGGFINDVQSIENVSTGSGNDSIGGAAEANLIHGNGGNDTISGGEGNDTLYGGTGDDVLQGQDGKVRLFGDDGNDRLSIRNQTDSASRIDGGAGTGDVLVLEGAGLAWVVDLSTGSLVIGATSIVLAGIESVENNTGEAQISGTNGANTLIGGQFSETLRGLGGDDLLVGGSGSDSIEGGAGNDTLALGDGAGAATVDGGSAVDRLTLDGTLAWIFDSAGHGSRVGGLGTVTVLGVEVVELGGQADNLVEAGDMNVIYGGGGADSIYDNGFNSVDDMFYGGTGRDLFDFGAATGDRVLDLTTGAYSGNGGAVEFEDVRGGIWNDSITGSAEDNSLAGGDGNDSLLGADGNDSLTGEVGRDSLVGGDGADTLVGGSDQDILFGDAKSDSLYGEAAADTLNGGANNDMLDGGTENDLLSGNTGDDLLLGQAGQDRLLGGIGVDTLTGGLDADGFIWAALSEGGVGEAADVVTDFGIGADKLVLTAIGGLTWIDTAGFSGVAGQVRQSTTGANTTLAIDSDGDRDADMEILLQNHGAIAAGDLLL